MIMSGRGAGEGALPIGPYAGPATAAGHPRRHRPLGPLGPYVPRAAHTTAKREATTPAHASTPPQPTATSTRDGGADPLGRAARPSTQLQRSRPLPMPSQEASAFEEWDGDDGAVETKVALVATHASSSETLDIADFEWAAPFDLDHSTARRAASREAMPALADRDAAASALEEIALRVRVGEIVPLGFSSGRSPAAALAATLTALLNRE